MNRRELLQGSAALSLTAFATLAQADAGPEAGHDMHAHHHGAPTYAELAHAATHCVMFGDACLGHCIVLLGQGDTSLAECAQSVQQMTSACNTLRQLASWNSPYVPHMAKVVMEICKDCEAACRKHEKEHEECRKCGESCAACYQECARVAA